ncbi:helix-turn-helix domain-containing protein [Caldimonas tepidiphila]|uniref:helix-turn-helix domain-containing protein n=1 Tax=Caldimonas tepidiphila TaxID=2315841 RepID=UPI000E5ABB07|nr:AraC family transcriptional regulator [Caldimonas tepidiphila]
MERSPRAALSLRHYGAAPGSHDHAHFQLLWGWQGRLELEVEGRGARLGAGQALIIPPGARHDFHSREGSRCFVLDTADETGLPLAQAARVLELAPAAQHLLRFLAARPEAAALEDDSPLAGAAARLLLSTLANVAPAARAVRRIDWPALEAWIDAHLAEPLDVARLAAQVLLSPSQFAARCVAETGRAPIAWLRERRLLAARRLRAEGRQVQCVARLCGYRSPSALTAALRRDRG